MSSGPGLPLRLPWESRKRLSTATRLRNSYQKWLAVAQTALRLKKKIGVYPG
jgi:hypothetical protein